MSCGAKFPIAPPTGPQVIPPPIKMDVPPPMQTPVPAKSSDFITLSCPNCGGKLNITSDVDRFACQFCGHEHIVRRSGSMISLEPVVQAMNMMGVGVSKLGFSSEKQVAEQAIARLKTEILEVEAQVKSLEGVKPFNVSMGILAIVIGVIGFIVASFTTGWIAIFGLAGLIFGIIMLATPNPPKTKKELMETKQKLIQKKAELEQNYEIVRQH
jgi:predicted RNA-binding Zn-ribbon protein involved in translation (DUF1610 family)